MTSTLKKEVFVLYKRILRLGTTWKAVDPNRTSEERKYIIEEAKFWFRKNSRLADLQTIQDHIKEGEARFEMGEYLFLYLWRVARVNFFFSFTLQESISQTSQPTTKCLFNKGREEVYRKNSGTFDQTI